MPILTLEAVRETPWNVVTYMLPERPERLLLELAYFAADYCRCSEALLVRAARERRYVPTWWRADQVCPDAHEDSENCSYWAERKMDEIGALYEKEFGECLERYII
jgi:hypothetical protein